MSALWVLLGFFSLGILVNCLGRRPLTPEEIKLREEEAEEMQLCLFGLATLAAVFIIGVALPDIPEPTFRENELPQPKELN